MDKDVGAQSRARKAAGSQQPASDSSLSSEEGRPSPQKAMRANAWKKEGKDARVEEEKYQLRKKARRQEKIVGELVAKAAEDSLALAAEKKRTATLEKQLAKRARRNPHDESTSESTAQFERVMEENRVLAETLRATKGAMEQLQRSFQQELEDDGTGLSQTQTVEGQSGLEDSLPGGAGNSTNSAPETASRVIAGGGAVKFAVQVDPLQSLQAKDCLSFLTQAQLQNANQAGFLWQKCVVGRAKKQLDLMQQALSKSPTQPWHSQFGIDQGHWSEWNWTRAEQFFTLYTSKRQGGKTEDIPGQVCEHLKGTDPQDFPKSVGKWSEAMTFVESQKLNDNMHQQVITRVLASLEDGDGRWKQFHKKLASDARYN
mgnify:CR=1 FL=1